MFELFTADVFKPTKTERPCVFYSYFNLISNGKIPNFKVDYKIILFLHQQIFWLKVFLEHIEMSYLRQFVNMFFVLL